MDLLISYGLVYLAALITLVAQGFVSTCYSKYKRIKNESNINGHDIARYILDKNGLSNIEVKKVRGTLTDHYDPINKVIRLSSDIFEGKSISSIAVASHECGHAIQDKEGYLMMKIRSSLVPIVNFSSYMGYLAILLGIIFGSSNIIWLGIIFELAVLLFQIVTLPVEINASKRALNELKNNHMIKQEEISGSKMVLIAAASTYLASVASTLLQILRLIILFGREDD